MFLVVVSCGYLGLEKAPEKAPGAKEIARVD
jgi:hypothetical protein